MSREITAEENAIALAEWAAEFGVDVLTLEGVSISAAHKKVGVSYPTASAKTSLQTFAQLHLIPADPAPAMMLPSGKSATQSGRSTCSWTASAGEAPSMPNKDCS